MRTERLTLLFNLKAMFLIWTISLLLLTHLAAQSDVSKLNKKEIAVTIDSISRKLNKNYVFPEVAVRMIEVLKTNLKSGKYSSLTNSSELANQLTKDLQEISKDKHLM